ncbi:MAG: 8-oxo-dGTP diphosphatase [Candidatus Taylorbacteria bacterium]|nr:8-oxo-dGTP diphosphatase [Candidatus Taylorbacteria bacterium]
MNSEQIIKVGIGVTVFKDGKILMGKRKKAHGSGEYAYPGGHFEYMESFIDSAQREVREETGIEIDNIRFLGLLNLKNYAPKHYVHIMLAADWKSGEPQVLEPEKCEGWDWYEVDNLPSPRFATADKHIEAIKTGVNFFDN